jgi:hypothetical protein
MGLYQRRGSRFWWMTYTMNEERYFESTQTTSKELAKKIWKRREIAMGLFKVGWPGEKMRRSPYRTESDDRLECLLDQVGTSKHVMPWLESGPE